MVGQMKAMVSSQLLDKVRGSGVQPYMERCDECWTAVESREFRFYLGSVKKSLACMKVYAMDTLSSFTKATNET